MYLNIWLYGCALFRPHSTYVNEMNLLEIRLIYNAQEFIMAVAINGMRAMVLWTAPARQLAQRSGFQLDVRSSSITLTLNELQAFDGVEDLESRRRAA